MLRAKGHLMTPQEKTAASVNSGKSIAKLMKRLFRAGCRAIVVCVLWGFLYVLWQYGNHRPVPPPPTPSPSATEIAAARLNAMEKSQGFVQQTRSDEQRLQAFAEFARTEAAKAEQAVNRDVRARTPGGNVTITFDVISTDLKLTNSSINPKVFEVVICNQFHVTDGQQENVGLELSNREQYVDEGTTWRMVKQFSTVTRDITGKCAIGVEKELAVH